MKNKMKFLIKQSLNKKVKTKWFKVVNILLLFLIVAITNIDKIIGFFGGDFDEATKIVVVDETGTYETFKTMVEQIAVNVEDFGKFEIEKSDASIDTLKEDIEEEHEKIVIVLQKDEKEYMKAQMISYDPLSTITSQVLQTSLNAVKSEYALATSGIDPEVLSQIVSPISIENIATNPELDADAEARDLVANVVVLIFVIPFFILIVLLVQMIGAEINDEKTTKSMEIIISNVSPKTHFLSKIIASTGFVLLQAILLFGYIFIGVLVRLLVGGGIGIAEGSSLGEAMTSVMDMLRNSGILSALGQSIILIIALLVLNLFAFALLAGILASMTTSTEDFQQLQTPLMLICMAGYYLAFMASVFQGATFIKVFSLLPFFSAMIAPVLYLLGQTTIWHLIFSVLITGATCFLLFHYGLRIYKVGILNYSSKDLWKKIFKSMKQKD